MKNWKVFTSLFVIYFVITGYIWGPSQGNYCVDPMNTQAPANPSMDYIVNWVVGSKDYTTVITKLSCKEVADASREQYITGKVKYPCKPLALYSEGSGYRESDPQIIPGPVKLDDKLQKHLSVARTIIDYNGYRYTVDLPIKDNINGYDMGSCYNPLVDKQPIPGWTPTPVLPTPTPEIPQEKTPTPTPEIPQERTPTPTPTPTHTGSGGMVVPVVRKFSEPSIVTWSAVQNSIGVTVLFYPDKEEKNTPGPTPPVETTPTGCPPGTPPPTPFIPTPVSTQCPEEVVTVPTSTTNTGQPQAPTDDLLIKNKNGVIYSP